MIAKFNSYSACHEDGDLLRKDGERWSFVRTLDVHDVRIEPWIGGSTLALYVPFTEGPPWGYALTVLDGKAVAPRAMSAQGAHQPSGPTCTSRLVQATSLVTFASGEVFVLALNECPEASDGQSILAERWAAGAHQSSVDRLPLDEPDLDLDPAISQEPIPLTAPSPSNVWVSGVLPGTTEPALAHFDGRDWSLVVTNLPGSVTSVAWRGAVEGGGSDPQLWMVSRGRVYRGRPEWQPVEPVPLPGGVGDAVAVWVDDANAVWVGAEHAVVATGEWATPLAWPAPAEDDCKVQIPPRPAAPRGMSGAVKSASRGGCGDDKEHHVPAGDP